MEDLRERVTRPQTRPPEELLNLGNFIAKSPNRTYPKHLEPLLKLFARIAAGETVQALVSTPPQHGKTVSVLHGLVWLLQRDPTKRHAYATYAQEFTNDNSLDALAIAEDTPGVHLTRNTLKRWTTLEGGGITWTSRGGPLTGRPVDGLLLLDDLIKDPAEASSPVIRRKAMHWLSGTAFTRLHPGSSIILIATRWHLDDPTGQLLKEGGWEYIELPALDKRGRALWPEERPVDWLMEQKRRTIPQFWSAMYLCKPQVEGQEVFQDSYHYENLPAKGAFRTGHGFDAAYTKSTSADYSVVVGGRFYNEPGNPPEKGRLYITSLLRDQLEAGQFVKLMQAHNVRRVSWIRSGTEKGLEALLKQRGIRVDAVTASTDKLNRAINLAAAWNDGRVLLPKHAVWTQDIEEELSRFTGIGDAHDDIVDAMAALYNSFMTRTPLSAQTRARISPW